MLKVDSAELLDQISALRTQAEKLESEQAKARDEQVAAETKLAMLSEQLQERYQCSDWKEADSLLAKMKQEAENGLQSVLEAFQEAGVCLD